MAFFKEHWQLLIVFILILVAICWQWRRPEVQNNQHQGKWWRNILLVVLFIFIAVLAWLKYDDSNNRVEFTSVPSVTKRVLK